ncbi:hypothetical protein [Aliarcobacter butzleri]|uniref:hypothetical protein n=1 Tax=Aliarcobacter butzleri TaxID=28197 RepID=UPI002B2474F9|nr:hypothetical protein [Aliarcobacter butzleri]
MIFLIIDLIQKFDYKIDQTNIKEFLQALQKLEEHQHQIFLEDLKKTLQQFDNKIKLQEIEISNSLKEKNSDRQY